jgi:hypothetical protein
MGRRYLVHFAKVLFKGTADVPDSITCDPPARQWSSHGARASEREKERRLHTDELSLVVMTYVAGARHLLDLRPAGVEPSARALIAGIANKKHLPGDAPRGDVATVGHSSTHFGVRKDGPARICHARWIVSWSALKTDASCEQSLRCGEPHLNAPARWRIQPVRARERARTASAARASPRACTRAQPWKERLLGVMRRASE